MSGVLPILAAFDVGPFKEGKHAPDWVLGAAGGLFLFAGLFIWTAGSALGKVVATVLPVAMFGGFAAIANWVAFGAGPRECSASISGFGGAFGYGAGDLECRIAFGIGAMLLNGALLMLAGHLLGHAFGPHRAFDWIGKLGKGLVGLVLLPFFAVLFVAEWVRGRLRREGR